MCCIMMHNLIPASLYVKEEEGVHILSQIGLAQPCPHYFLVCLLFCVANTYNISPCDQSRMALAVGLACKQLDWLRMKLLKQAVLSSDQEFKDILIQIITVTTHIKKHYEVSAHAP